MPMAMTSAYPTNYGMSKADLRKSNKPIMEKRRRARINNCLDELKSLILDAMKKDPARHSKLEKADILEMTVKHLQEIQREQMRNAVASDPSVLAKFHNGFTECATEVSRYITYLDGVDDGVRRRLVGHLTGCVTGLSQVLPLATTTTDPSTVGNVNVSSAEDVNNNNRGGDRSSNNSSANSGGLRLVPSRLPSGELAILLPGMEEHKSAFKAVVGGKTTPSPLSPISPTIPPSPLHSLHSISSDHITSTTPEPHTELIETNTDQKTIASTSESQNNPEMWRPW